MPSEASARLQSRIRRALVGPATRDSIIVSVCALLCAGLIFGLLYDVFDTALRRWADRDLNRSAHLTGLALEPHAAATPAVLQATLERISSNQDASALAACRGGSMIAGTGIARTLACTSELARSTTAAEGRSTRGVLAQRNVVVTAHGLGGDGTLFVVQDRTFLDARRKHVLQIVFVGAELVLVALLLLARAGARLGSRRTAEAARSIVRGMRAPEVSGEPVPPGLRLLVREMRDTVEHLGHQRPSAPTGAQRLSSMAGDQLAGGLVVIANREPYSHEYTSDGGVVMQRPASGLVTGIEPVLRACGGTWIAYGGGSADRVTADRSGHIAVPPESPEYTLRRIWIEEREYERYYSGFANEGLWPLCHTAHTQPSFRAEDWRAYQSVNETFARAAVDETGTDGLLLIQDYHFALVPKAVREQAPHIATSFFWHIPWPNAEVVGICPWKEALMKGMLGADIMGFHTRQYCLNFLESVQRYLECRVDLDDMSVTSGGHRTLVRPYPISVQWPYPAASRATGSALRASLGIAADAHVALGVDRADYTKGLLERIAAVETLLDQNPSLHGSFVYVQLASPTRTSIRRYRDLAEDLTLAVQRVNARFATSTWQPIVLQMRTFSPDDVRVYYAMADSALVTPLHDGMNLVAKEYAAATGDGNGTLILSVFAGAAKELEGALLVNPYDIEQVADALLRAINMPLAERNARMQSMRVQIAANSIYDWSQKMLTDLHEVRQQGGRFWPQRPSTVKGRDPRKVAAV
jgi:trehalose-6-phosphate synthase